MSINDSLRSQLDNHVQQMYTKNLKGEKQSTTQTTAEGSVKDLSQALADNKITGKELEALKQEYAKQGISGEDVEKAISDVFKIPAEKLKSAGTSDAVISLEMEDSGKMVNTKDKDGGQGLHMMTRNFSVMTDNDVNRLSKDSNINFAINAGLDLDPKNTSNVKELQKFLNNYQIDGKKGKLSEDGQFGPNTIDRLKDVIADALKHKDFKTIDKLLPVMEILTNNFFQADTELNAINDVAHEFWEKNTQYKVKVEVEKIK